MRGMHSSVRRSHGRDRTALSLALALVMGIGLGWPAVAAPDPVGAWPINPAPPPIVEGFDPPTDPYGRGHRGVDLLASPGRTVAAALPGTVSFVGGVAGRPVVVINHGSTRTTYEPVVGVVDVDANVVAGQPIGRLQLTGSHCFPRSCLHWGWKRGDLYLDPLMLVGGGPIRLLPLTRANPGLPGVRPAGVPADRPDAAGRSSHACSAGWSPAMHDPVVPEPSADLLRPRAGVSQPYAAGRVARCRERRAPPRSGGAPSTARCVDRPFARAHRQTPPGPRLWC